MFGKKAELGQEIQDQQKDRSAIVRTGDRNTVNSHPYLPSPSLPLTFHFSFYFFLSFFASADFFFGRVED